MSSYLTIRLNKSVILCVSRSNKLYEYCNAPYCEDYEVFNIEDISLALDIANMDLSEKLKLKDKYETMLKCVFQDISTVGEVMDLLEDCDDTIEEINMAISDLRFIKNIFYEQEYRSFEDIECESVEPVLDWNKG